MENTDDKLMDIDYRLMIIQHIQSQENKDRKEQSLQDTEVYAGDIEPYVLNKFNEKYSAQAVQEIPIVSTINVSKKVVDAKATVYKASPVREFNEVSDSQEEVLGEVYTDMQFDSIMLDSNRLFKLQKQNHIFIVPKHGRLTARAIKQHQLDVIPFSNDPEEGEVYILTGYDKSMSALRVQAGDGMDQEIADPDDYLKLITRHVVWSRNYHFVMDGNGMILGEETDNPISMIPFVEVSNMKDFEYFLRGTNNITKFTVEYNEALSNMGQIVHMQGFAQAYLKSPEDLMPSQVVVGPTKILKLVTNSAVDGDVEFGYASPSSDLAGARTYVESLLSQFLSSEGLNADAVTGSAQASNFTSGVERLLALVEKFEASKDDFGRYERAEKKLFKVIAAWLNALSGSDQLDDKYKTEVFNLENVSLSITFEKPEIVQTELEQLDIIERKLDMNLMTREDAIMELENKTAEEAATRTEEIDQANEEEIEEITNGVPETEVNTIGSESDV